MIKKPIRSALYNFIQQACLHRGKASRLDRNSALCDTMQSGIILGMGCVESDVRDIYHTFGGNSWFYGEKFYMLAVQKGNSPFCAAFESWKKRPAVLWAEKTKTPKRLKLMDEFTWEGKRVRITSMEREHLIACEYERTGEDTSYSHIERGYRTKVAVTEQPDGGVVIEYGPVRKESRYERERIISRKRITYAAIAAQRKAYDAERREWEKRIAAADTAEAIQEVRTSYAAGHEPLRHFDIESLNVALRIRSKAIEDAAQKLKDKKRRDEQWENRRRISEQNEATWDADIIRWMAGENLGRYFDHDDEKQGRHVRLRISGNRVETSNGMEVSLAGATAALTFILRKRKVGYDGKKETICLDEHTIKSIDKDGAQIGCTFFIWQEVERFACLVKAHNATLKKAA